jgi:TIR domain
MMLQHSSHMDYTMPHHVFLSYSRKDSDMMIRVRRDLGIAGLDVWKSENLTHGTAAWHKAAEKAIKQSRCMVVILSPDAKESEWVKRQLAHARDYNKRIFPILADGDGVDTIPNEMIDMAFFDLRSDYTAGLEALITALYAHLNINGSIPKRLTTPAEASKNSDSVQKPIFTLPDFQNRDEAPPHDFSAFKPWNPVDQARLLVWLFADPAQYTAFQRQVGKEEARKAGVWLTSTLIWLPFLIPTLGIQLGLTPTNKTGAITESFPIWAIVIVLVWRWTGFQMSENSDPSIILRGVTAVVIVGGIAFSLAFGLANIMAGGLALVTALIVAVILSLEMATGLTFYLALGIVAGLIIGLLLDSQDGGLFGVIIGFIFAFVFLIFARMARGVALVANRSSRKRAVPGGMFMLLALGTAYAVLIWIYWLGGWGVVGT